MLNDALNPPASTIPPNSPGCSTPGPLPADAVAKLEASPSIVPRRSSFQLVRMATAKFKQHFIAPHGHKLFRSNSSNLSAHDKPIDEEQRRKEKDFISCFECNQAPLSPSQIAETPRNKEVGAASKQLRVGDFELIKTIGTGGLHVFRCYHWRLNSMLIGTFARVWLTCLAGSPKDHHKVFALKILRKTDSKLPKPPIALNGTT